MSFSLFTCGSGGCIAWITAGSMSLDVGAMILLLTTTTRKQTDFFIRLYYSSFLNHIHE